MESINKGVGLGIHYISPIIVYLNNIEGMPWRSLYDQLHYTSYIGLEPCTGLFVSENGLVHWIITMRWLQDDYINSLSC